VAVLALHGGVGAEQRKAVHVIFNLLDGYVPPLNGVTLCTVGTHLSAVNVLVAIRAILAYVGENRLHVTLHTGNFFMHSAEWILCFVVIEFGDRTNGAPASGGMTVLTGNGQRTMRTLGGFLLLGLRCGGPLLVRCGGGRTAATVPSWG